MISGTLMPSQLHPSSPSVDSDDVKAAIEGFRAVATAGDVKALMRRYDQHVLSAAWRNLDPLTKGALELMRGLNNSRNTPEILPPDFQLDVPTTQ